MANVKLSKSEFDLVTNSSFILTKNNIITKVYTLFGQLAQQYQNHPSLQILLQQYSIETASPKISKGEQYQQLPWVMLDYPRQFGKQDIFAIRSFFWWGNCFSITLHLQGKYQQQFLQKIQALQSSTLNNDWYICINDTAWEHHFNNNNYIPLQQFANHNLPQLQFIKLAKKIPLHQWDEAELFFQNTFSQIIAILSN